LTDIMQPAVELFERGHFSSVVAVCMDALGEQPDDTRVRTLLARALVALRQDRQAERELGELLRRDGNSSMAFQLLGEIAYRRDELQSAQIYFRESSRLDPQNASARIWLDVTLTTHRSGPSQSASGMDESGPPVLPKPASRRLFAKGTDPMLASYGVVARERGRLLEGEHPRELPAAPVRARTSQNILPRRTRADRDDAPDDGRFGGYLVRIGALSREQLQRSLAYQRTHRLRVGDAAVALGYIAPQKADWAALGFHSRQRC
jgi:tetratricopeptide (TPR) repeat protein